MVVVGMMWRGCGWEGVEWLCLGGCGVVVVVVGRVWSGCGCSWEGVEWLLVRGCGVVVNIGWPRSTL